MAVRKILAGAINPEGGMVQGFRAVFGAENVWSFDHAGLSKAGVPRAEISSSFVEAARQHQPDWVWLQIHDRDTLLPEAIQEVKNLLPSCVVTHFMGDYRPVIGELLASIAQVCHLALVSNEDQPKDFVEAGAPEAMYCPIAADWSEDILGIPDWDPPFRVPDVVFCGSNYGDVFPGTKDRETAARYLMDSGLDFGIVGKGWPSNFPMVGHCSRNQQVQIYRRAKVVLSINNYNTVRRYYSNRQFVALASGRPVVVKTVPGIQDDFKDGEDCVFYTKPKHLPKIVESILEDPTWAYQLGCGGRSVVLERHTWFSRILKVLPRIEMIAGRIS